MMMLPLLLAFERAIPFFLFTLYLVTAVRICSYGAWCDAGSPNPFLPRKLKLAVASYEARRRPPRAG